MTPLQRTRRSMRCPDAVIYYTATIYGLQSLDILRYYWVNQSPEPRGGSRRVGAPVETVIDLQKAFSYAVI
jgi:hypothetical protein